MCTACLALALLLLCAANTAAEPPQPTVEAEEEVYTYTPADNGADPMWCWGCTCLARAGDRLFASGLETLPNARPLNNVRWLLFGREATGGWKLLQTDPKDRTREPCPLAGFPDGRLLMSVNPTLVTDPQHEGGGPARPEILQFAAASPLAPPRTILPTWEGQPAFSEHSYRTFSADGTTGEAILLQNVGYDGSAWTLLDPAGSTIKSGYLQWPELRAGDIEPYGATRCRVNYPDVFLRNRAVYVCGAAAFDNWDRVTNPATQKHLMGRQWGNRWRRLFYTWTPDATAQPFHNWIEISNTMATGGWLFPGDLWVDDTGLVHLLWFEGPIDLRLRNAHFLDLTHRPNSIMYAQVRDGRIMHKTALLQGGEGSGMLVPESKPRFHVAPGGRLFVVYCAFDFVPPKQRTYTNWIQEIKPDGTTGEAVRLPLQHPLGGFFTVTPRGGGAPSEMLDLLGPRVGSQSTIHYARVRLGL
jgi:hypothetical protein